MADLDRTPDTNTFKIIKQTLTHKVLPRILAQNLIAFFTRNHTLPIETGRWQNIQVPRMKCPLCEEICYKFHYLYKCPIFITERAKYINRQYYIKPNTRTIQF